jgi:prepilin-type N-terminal cleavage/methylation domain-containing protein
MRGRLPNGRGSLSACKHAVSHMSRAREQAVLSVFSVRHKRQKGVTLIELLIAVLLLSLLSVGIVLTLRVALSAMNKSGSKLMANRRVSSVERILDQEIEGIMPVTADCQPRPGVVGTTLMFFQGQPQSMRLASTYSLQQGERGVPMILEFQVVPGEDEQGVRLVVNEHWYTGPRGAGMYCLGIGAGPDGGPPGPMFTPISVGPDSFVLVDKLAYCRFSYRDLRTPPAEMPIWVQRWVKPVLPNAIRIEMAPLAPDLGRLQPVTLTIPVHVTRLPLPMEPYENEN